MKLEFIRDLAMLVKLEAEWSSFAASLTELTPFQSPAWLLTWWNYFGNGELRVAVFQEQGNIVAIVPCFLHEWNGSRQLTLIGSGISDYLEPPIRSDFSSEVVDQLRCYLQSETDWDLCNFQDLSCETPLKALSNGKLHVKAVDDIECRRVQFTGNFAQYWQSRSSKLRKNVRRDRAKQELLGVVEFTVRSEADPELLTALTQIHAARWQARGQPGMIAANSSADFITEIAARFAANGMLRIFSLRLDKKIAAIIFGFCQAKSVFGYLTAFDPEYEHLGAGRTLLFESFRYCVERGYAVWDFLRGNEPYKLWWGGERVPKCRLLIRRR